MFTLSNLPKTVLQGKKRVGRGVGSGRGKNSGKGNKGQNKHGQGVRIGFEGGQKTIIRRTPKFRGFKAIDKKDSVVLNLDVLEKNYLVDETVNFKSLLEKGLVNKFIKKVRILNSGSLKKAIKFDETENIYLTKGVRKVLSLESN